MIEQNQERKTGRFRKWKLVCDDWSSLWVWPRISTNPRLLSRLLRSENIRARKLGLNALASMKTLPDWQCIELMQSCYDAGLMSSLALRGSNVPEFLKRFIPPKSYDEKKPTVEKELKSLLKSLHPYTRDLCVQLNTELALRNIGHTAVSEHEEVLWLEHDEDERPVGLFGSSSQLQKLLLYMEALGLESTLPNQRERLIDAATFDLLARVWQVNLDIAPTDFRLPILILKIVSNLALSQGSAGHFLHSGWISTLAKCRKMGKIEVRLLAEKCLANLCNGSMAKKDEKRNWISYDDGVYILHESRDKEPSADIIFVHGLRGGVFYSWRQKDLAKKMEIRIGKEKVTLPTEGPYTYCWPKDWLPSDIKTDVRVLGIDYASFVTDWRMKCPEFHERNTIIARSKDLLEKLDKAGVGERPIVWVCHSMGGLLVKELLCPLRETDHDDENAAAKWSKYADKTIGIAFYAVPHRGSPVASRTNEWNYRYFLLPSVEVSELRENSKYLQLLQENFLKFAATSSVPVISFCETLPSRFPMGFQLLVVPPISSRVDIGSHYRLNDSHLNTCKPLNRFSLNYRVLIDFLNRVLSDK